MKTILLILIVGLFTGCKKEAQQDCYMCQWTSADNVHHGETKCGDKPAPYYIDSLGNTIFMQCIKK